MAREGICENHGTQLRARCNDKNQNDVRKFERADVYNCFGHNVGDALKVEIVCTATGEVVASKWDEDLPRCAVSRKSAINKTGWDGDTFRVSIGRPKPFDSIIVKIPTSSNI